MRVARDAREVAECFALATDEAKKSFGDDRLLVEKFVAAPRHVEIQLVADAHGKEPVGAAGGMRGSRDRVGRQHSKSGDREHEPPPVGPGLADGARGAARRRRT